MADPDENGAPREDRTANVPGRAGRALAAAAALPLAFAVALEAARAPALLGATLGAPAVGPPPALLHGTPLARAPGLAPLADALAAAPAGGAALLAGLAALAAALRFALARRPPGLRALAASIAWTLAIALVLGLEVPRRRALVSAAAAALVVAAMARARPPRKRALAGGALALVIGVAAIGLQRARDAAPLRDGLAAATARPARPPSGAREGRSVVLLTLDTTRRDALGSLGGPPRSTPHLDAFAERAVVHERAVSPSPHTHPAMASLLTGLSPLEHGSLSGAPMLADDARTLAEHLADLGYRTAGFLDNPWLWGGFGLERGYAHLERRADLTRIERWLDAGGAAPFLLHVHLFQPHGPYELRADERAALSAGGTLRPPAAARIGDRIDARVIRASECPARHAFTADEIAWMREVQESEVRAMDAWIGEFLGALEARGLLGTSVVVVAADHGEEFGERGGLHHSHTLFGELVDVPLLVHAPGLVHRRERRVTSLERVPRIVTDLAGVPALEEAANTPRAAGPALSIRARQGGRHLLRARDGRWALHARITPAETSGPAPAGSAATVEFALFDLAVDPGERIDVARERADVVAGLRAEPEVAAALAALEGLPVRRGAAAAPERTRAAAELDVLGYSR